MRLQKLPEGQYEYVHATFYFGLRPSELDSILKDKSNFKITASSGVKVLNVNQSKLSSIAEDKRWKGIPAILPEQLEAIKNLQSGKIKKPLLKTIKKILTDHPTIGLYSGRKGFTDLMLSYNQTLEDISAWMGHKSIDRTWKHYKNKKAVTFTPIKKAKNG